MTVHSLIPWNQLTRAGTSIPPEFRVIRRPIETQGHVYNPGDVITATAFSPAIARARLRQYYEARLIEPKDPPPNSRQAYRERMTGAQRRAIGGGAVTDIALSVTETPLSFEAPLLTVGEESSTQPYRPSRKSEKRRP